MSAPIPTLPIADDNPSDLDVLRDAFAELEALVRRIQDLIGRGPVEGAHPGP